MTVIDEIIHESVNMRWLSYFIYGMIWWLLAEHDHDDPMIGMMITVILTMTPITIIQTEPMLI